MPRQVSIYIYIYIYIYNDTDANTDTDRDGRRHELGAIEKADIGHSLGVPAEQQQLFLDIP